MRTRILLLVVAFSMAGCSRPRPTADAPVVAAQPPVESTESEAEPRPAGEIAFLRWAAGKGTTLHLLDLTTGEERILAGGSYTQGPSAWSPDGSRLATSGRSDGRRTAAHACTAFLLDPSGGTPTPITHYRDAKPRYPDDDAAGANWDRDYSWSPDGTRLLFEEYFGEAEGLPASGIGLAWADGRPERIIAPGTRCSVAGWPLEDNGKPRWSPKGDRLLWIRCRMSWPDARSDGFSVITASPDGSGQRELVRGASAAEWSPDGTRIAFVAPDDRGPAQSDPLPPGLYVLPARGGPRPECVYEGPAGGDYGRLDWSPDGSSIAFTVGGWPSDETWVAVLRVRDHRVLAKSSVSDDDCPSWSPDGEWIAFVRGVAPSWDLWVMDRDGQHERLAAKGVEPYGGAQWRQNVSK